jgi:equilibrative nucleoside transporter 1/2/3
LAELASNEFRRAQFLYWIVQDAEVGNNRSRKTTTELFRENWDYALMLVLIYLLSLSIFPGFLYEDTGKHQLGDW